MAKSQANGQGAKSAELGATLEASLGSSPANAPAPLLTILEKRRRLARAVRVNLLDCLDDTGAFDLARARTTLTGGIVQELVIDETETRHPPKQGASEGRTTIRRKIRVKIIDKIRAMKTDDALAEYAYLQEDLDTQTERAEKAEARAKQAESRAAQAETAKRELNENIDEEVGRRTHQAMHVLLKDSCGNLLPGVTPLAFKIVEESVNRHYPRPPPQAA